LNNQSPQKRTEEIPDKGSEGLLPPLKRPEVTRE